MRFNARRREALALLAAALSMPALTRGAAELKATVAGGSDSATVERKAFLDLMPDFWAVYDGHFSSELPTRAQTLFEGFFRKYANVYLLAGYEFKLDDIVRWLPRFDGRVAATRVVHMRFARDYESNLGRFRAALRDFDDRASPVTLLPSLTHFDAHLQANGSSLPLFFGPDAIAYCHGADADLGVFFSHELFHCYQGQKNPAMCLDPSAPLYVSLWMEGTATYASERLNPSASPLHVLLDDATLAQADISSLRAAAQSMLSKLDARDEGAQSLFFEAGHHGDPKTVLGRSRSEAFESGHSRRGRRCATMAAATSAAGPQPVVRERQVSGGLF